MWPKPDVCTGLDTCLPSPSSPPSHLPLCDSPLSPFPVCNSPLFLFVHSPLLPLLLSLFPVLHLLSLPLFPLLLFTSAPSPPLLPLFLLSPLPLRSLYPLSSLASPALPLSHPLPYASPPFLSFVFTFTPSPSPLLHSSFPLPPLLPLPLNPRIFSSLSTVSSPFSDSFHTYQSLATEHCATGRRWRRLTGCARLGDLSITVCSIRLSVRRSTLLSPPRLFIFGCNPDRKRNKREKKKRCMIRGSSPFLLFLPSPRDERRRAP